MNDPIYAGFLARQHEALADLSRRSSVFDFQPIRPAGTGPANVFLITLTCRHAIWRGDTAEVVAGPCEVGIQLPGDYLRRGYPDASRILSLISPAACHHPNIRWPYICSGPIAPGTSVTELVLRVYEILTYNRHTPREDDCLNAAACQWARAHVDEFPLERRPLIDPEAVSAPAADDFQLTGIGTQP